MGLQSGIAVRELPACTLRELFLAHQAHARIERRKDLRVIGLRNDIRGLMGADLIKTAQPKARDEEAIEELMEDWSGWIDAHTN